MTDKELLITSLSQYVGTMSKDLFGVNIGAAGSAIVKLGIENMMKKDPYKIAMDFLFDEDENLPSVDDFFDSLKAIVDQKPIQIWKVRLNGGDVDEVRKLFNKARK